MVDTTPRSPSTPPPPHVNTVHEFVYRSRSQLNENVFHEKYSFKPAKSNNVLHDTKNYVLKYYKPSRSCMSTYLFKRIPFLKWIGTYDYKKHFLKDFIAGLTIGIVQIPQG